MCSLVLPSASVAAHPRLAGRWKPQSNAEFQCGISYNEFRKTRIFGNSPPFTNRAWSIESVGERGGALLDINLHLARYALHRTKDGLAHLLDNKTGAPEARITATISISNQNMTLVSAEVHDRDGSILSPADITMWLLGRVFTNMQCEPQPIQ